MIDKLELIEYGIVTIWVTFQPHLVSAGIEIEHGVFWVYDMIRVKHFSQIFQSLNKISNIDLV